MRNYKLITEGNTKIYISNDTKDNDFDDPKASDLIFYNKNMELNRDITIAVMYTYKKYILNKDNTSKNIDYIDAFTASGIRGIRAAKELGFTVILNDLKKELKDDIYRNIQINNVENLATVTIQDANILLSNKKASFVDIDPFGSPSMYIDSAIRSAKNMLNITATDTASLCGAHLNSGIRKYLAFPENSEFHSELGLRILIGFICRSMSKYNKTINVLFSHATRHYVRCYLEINYGIHKTNRNLSNIGYVIFCKNCKNILIKNGYVISFGKLCKCGHKQFISGPLWIGPLKSTLFCMNIIKNMNNNLKLNKKNEAIKLINSCINEIDDPFYYNYHKICKSLKVSAVKLEDVIQNLNKLNYRASRTHMLDVGIKTNASIDIINKVILQISKKRCDRIV